MSFDKFRADVKRSKWNPSGLNSHIKHDSRYDVTVAEFRVFVKEIQSFAFLLYIEVTKILNAGSTDRENTQSGNEKDVDPTMSVSFSSRNSNFFVLVDFLFSKLRLSAVHKSGWHISKLLPNGSLNSHSGTKLRTPERRRRDHLGVPLKVLTAHKKCM